MNQHDVRPLAGLLVVKTCAVDFDFRHEFHLVGAARLARRDQTLHGPPPRATAVDWAIPGPTLLPTCCCRNATSSPNSISSAAVSQALQEGAER